MCLWKVFWYFVLVFQWHKRLFPVWWPWQLSFTQRCTFWSAYFKGEFCWKWIFRVLQYSDSSIPFHFHLQHIAEFHSRRGQSRDNGLTFCWKKKNWDIFQFISVRFKWGRGQWGNMIVLKNVFHWSHLSEGGSSLRANVFTDKTIFVEPFYHFSGAPL